ncbi:MAG: hypothetical protein NXI30_27155 [bacterium]|nr:hypothetical protein [bacterium]
MSSPFRRGDRVRVINPNHEYTGARGTVSDAPSSQANGVAVLGHQVAIDGENGVTRPFLVADLEPLRAVRAGGRRRAAPSSQSDVRRSTDRSD